MSDRIYPNTAVFKTTDGKEVTYLNERVLKKIRDEIEKEYKESIAWVGDNDRYAQGIKKALEIIDKHVSCIPGIVLI